MYYIIMLTFRPPARQAGLPGAAYYYFILLLLVIIICCYYHIL